MPLCTGYFEERSAAVSGWQEQGLEEKGKNKNRTSTPWSQGVAHGSYYVLSADLFTHVFYTHIQNL